MAFSDAWVIIKVTRDTVNRTFDTIDTMEAPSSSGPSALSRMLESDGNFADKMSLEERDGEEEETTSVSAAPPGMCIECEDQPQEVLCEACGDVFCEVCFGALHRRGKRRLHVHKKLTDGTKTSTSQAPQKKARLVRCLLITSLTR